jgi:NAD-dependent dihydropyrimidine dehydrogenase PreA subunit
VTFVITQACLDVKDNACLEVCPVDCIYETSRMQVINPDECIDCGACEPACPVDAILPAAELPPESAAFEEINALIIAGADQVELRIAEYGPQ